MVNSKYSRLKIKVFEGTYSWGPNTMSPCRIQVKSKATSYSMKTMNIP